MQALLDVIAASAALPQGAQRLFHGRGGLHPGCEHLTLDAYPPALLLTSFEPLADEALAAIGAAIMARWPEAPWVFQCRQDGGRVQTRLMAGTLPEPHVVSEAGIPDTRYLVHLLRGQNHGLFLDMAEGRRWVREQVQPGAKVLNLFAYTCAFSVVALQAGAAEVVNVDMASGALAIGRTNHELNGVKAGARFLAHDIFNSWGKLTRGGPYDLVICDPPSFQKGSFVATKDYARLAKRLPALLAPGGQALLCLNTPKLGLDFLHGVVAEHAPELVFVERVANPEVYADVSADRGLKVLAYRLP
ncbi:class I SAM-dependent methyltransferase [Pelomonas sp. Root1237]|uniref:class I SAM-dependent methyltransferase n=1 Tax=Pelomonas sp. Root1237 TaxID=1736434 RepID=UPI0006F6C616|nr:class I SAM-dependent methyltransferase [Pelomonas sp. Root1237]KQV96483.1 SAM-dependent methyltransferase [Pelomonas sp. Root1237]